MSICRDCKHTRDNHDFLHPFDDINDPLVLVHYKSDEKYQLIPTSQFSHDKHYRVLNIRGIDFVVDENDNPLKMAKFYNPNK